MSYVKNNSVDNSVKSGDETSNLLKEKNCNDFLVLGEVLGWLVGRKKFTVKEQIHLLSEVINTSIEGIGVYKAIRDENGEIVERFTGLSSKLAYVNAINEAIK